MKRLTLLLLFMSLLSIGMFAQVGPATAPENLNWNPSNIPTGIRADPEVFLQGNFVEIGVATSGSCGTSSAAPAGFQNYPAYGGWLGFVADYGQDGWAVGTPPKSGDYFVPGTPEERWVLEWTSGATERNFNNSTLMGLNDIPQTSLTNTSSGSTNSCVWIGTAAFGAESILVNQKISFNDNDLFFVFDVTLTNTGTVTLTNIEYMRNVDPDQGLDVGCGFGTLNYVKHQPGWPGSGDTALVIAKTSGCSSIPLGLYAVHPNAVVSTEGFSNSDPDAILDSPVTYPEAAPNFADQAICLAFRFESLAPGQSIRFQYAYILSESALLEPPTFEQVPVSNWAIALMIGLVVVFTVIRLRRS